MGEREPSTTGAGKSEKNPPGEIMDASVAQEQIRNNVNAAIDDLSADFESENKFTDKYPHTPPAVGRFLLDRFVEIKDRLEGGETINLRDFLEDWGNKYRKLYEDDLAEDKRFDEDGKFDIAGDCNPLSDQLAEVYNEGFDRLELPYRAEKLSGHFRLPGQLHHHGWVGVAADNAWRPKANREHDKLIPPDTIFVDGTVDQFIQAAKEAPGEMSAYEEKMFEGKEVSDIHKAISERKVLIIGAEDEFMHDTVYRRGSTAYNRPQKFFVERA